MPLFSESTRETLVIYEPVFAYVTSICGCNSREDKDTASDVDLFVALSQLPNALPGLPNPLSRGAVWIPLPAWPDPRERGKLSKALRSCFGGVAERRPCEKNPQVTWLADTPLFHRRSERIRRRTNNIYRDLLPWKHGICGSKSTFFLTLYLRNFVVGISVETEKKRNEISFI